MNAPSRFRPFALPALGLLLLLSACGKAPPSSTSVRSVRTVVVGEAGGALSREFAADIRARTESRLGFRVAGKVSQRLVQLGQSVKVGQVLAQLDPQDLRLGQEAANAGLASAQANAEQARANLARFTELKSQGFISQAELDRHTLSSQVAEASLRQARSQSGVQGNQAGYAALKADAAGVITEVNLEPGQVVGAGQPVLTLAQDGPRDAVFAVPEDAVSLIKALLGQRGGVQVHRWGGDAWVPATVREVAAAADPMSRTYLVKADVGSVGFELGQTASVRMTAPVRAAQGIRVPLQAVFERDGQSVVWVLNPQTLAVQAVPVMTADVVGDVILVARGLQAGQEVVTAGAHVLQPGQVVRRYQSEPVKPEGSSPDASAPASSGARSVP